MGRRSWWQRSLNTHMRSLERRRKEEGRFMRRKEETLKQQGKAFEGASAAGTKDEAVTVEETLDRRKMVKELMWRGKWNRRRAKWDARKGNMRKEG